MLSDQFFMRSYWNEKNEGNKDVGEKPLGLERRRISRKTLCGSCGIWIRLGPSSDQAGRLLGILFICRSLKLVVLTPHRLLHFPRLTYVLGGSSCGTL